MVGQASAPSSRRSTASRAIQRVTLAVVGLVSVAYVVGFASEGIDAVLFFLPFTMTPLAITALLAWKCRTIAGQVVLLASALGYSAWLTFVYLSVVYWHPDPQGAIAFLFVGLYAAPALLLLWSCGIGCEAFRWIAKSRTHPAESSESGQTA